MFTFCARYFSLASILLVVEVMIAVYVHDAFVRPYIGDFLVIILLYCMLKSFFNISVIRAVEAVVLFAFIIEILQYFHLITLLHLQHSALAKVVLGSSFSWIDLLVYTAGAATILIVEHLRIRKIISSISIYLLCQKS